MINEQKLDVKVLQNGNVQINGHEFRLFYNVAGSSYWGVDVKKLTPSSSKDKGWEIEAGTWYAGYPKEHIPQDAVDIITKNLDKNIIDLKGKNDKNYRLEKPKFKKIKENKMERVVKLTETDIANLVRKVLKEHEQTNYMFFSNLEQIKRQCDMMLSMDADMIDKIIQNGHDWADDHITEAKTNIDQVFDFFKNYMSKESDYLDYEDINEGKKKAGTKLCARGKAAAKSKFKVWPSAYGNGFAVQVCQGRMKGLDGKKRCSPPYC